MRKEIKMKFISGFLIGGGLGATIVNWTLVPHGYNQGIFVGAVCIFVGGLVLSVDLWKRSKND